MLVWLHMVKIEARQGWD